MTEKSDILQTVMEVVSTFAGTGVVLDADTSLTEQLDIDSFNMVNILLELERRLSIQLSAADLTFDHFQSCRTLAEALASRKTT